MQRRAGTASGTLILTHTVDEGTWTKELLGQECSKPWCSSLLRLFCSPIAALGRVLLVKILDSRNEEHVSPRAEKLEEAGARVELRPGTPEAQQKFVLW